MSSLQKKNNRRVLILDDESDVLEFLRMHLTSLGWEVTAVATTAEAFGALEQQPYFLVIADIAMPDMDGYEFIINLRQKQIPSQVALMTGFGYNPRHTLVKIYKTSRYPCLFKPFNRKKVAETVQQAFDAYHAGPEGAPQETPSSPQ